MASDGAAGDTVTLKSVRNFLIREEDTIVFSLIERARYPMNSKAYAAPPPTAADAHAASLAELIIRDLEHVQATFGRYENPEETPFFPDNLPPPMVPPFNFPKFLHPPAASVNAIARRIHYGKYVAEVKFRSAPHDYEPAIRSKNRDALMRLLTDEKVEEMVKQRVAKKAKVFGQEVVLNDTNASEGDYKVNPAVVSRLYGEWVIPLTKLVEVEYLLRHLD